MKKLQDLSAEDAKKHFLKGSSYFNGDFPDYISFEPILEEVSAVLNGGYFTEHKASNPDFLSDVNYSLVANKDGRFAGNCSATTTLAGSDNQLVRWI